MACSLSTLSAGPPLSTTHSLALTRPRPTPVAVVCAITATVGGYAPYYEGSSVLCTTYSGPGQPRQKAADQAWATASSPPLPPLAHLGSPTAFPPISVRLNGDDVRALAMQCGPVNQSTSSASQSRPSRLPPQHPSPHQNSSSSSSSAT